MIPLKELLVVPIQSEVNHCVELYNGGMLAGLSSALANGITVNTVSLVEKNRTVRFMSNCRLYNLQRQYPQLLSASAIEHPFQLMQDVTQLTTANFTALPQVSVIFATPPCQPFSSA